MTISSSLQAGVAGLNANATRLAAISDNIANSATYGYKRADTEFFNMVISGSSSGSYSAGGVRTSTTRLIDERGSLISTSNPTDIAIGGRGFLPVSTASTATAGGDMPLLLSTTGSFRADENGYLVSESGLVLLGWPANSDGTIPAYSRDTMAGLQPVNVSTNQYVGDPTTALTLSVNLPATATQAGASGAVQEMSVEYYGNLGTSETLHLTYTPVVPATGSSNEWRLQISDSASGGSVIGDYAITFNTAASNGGTIAGITASQGGAYDAATGEIAVTTAHGPLTINLGAAGATGGLSQLSDTFTPGITQRDGSPVGNFSTVQITADGQLKAVYDNGFSRTIYQIPVADVPNPNGLTALNNQTFSVSPASGGVYFWDAGDGPTGEVAGFTREESATDVATELTQMIQTQRAYSSNAKVIQTVDEMLQETTNIKR